MSCTACQGEGKQQKIANSLNTAVNAKKSRRFSFVATSVNQTRELQVKFRELIGAAAKII